MKQWMQFIVSAGLLASLSSCALTLKPSSRRWDDGHTPQKWTKKSPPRKSPQKRVQPPKLNPQGPGAPIVHTAQKYLGIPYKWGGESPKTGFDCSGFVQYVYAENGILLKRLANHQFLQGKHVNQSELQAGDLVFFSRGQVVDHVGIYVGNRQFIHSPRTGRTVSYDSLDMAYYTRYYRGARRIY